MRHLNRYLQLQRPRPWIDADPSPDLSLAIVIPCLNEPELPELLSLLRGQMLPDSAVEILIVINHGEDAPPDIKVANTETWRAIQDWRLRHNTPIFQAHAIRAFDLPAKDAGVGLARKIGMDEAARRFAAIGNPAGVIVSLDADCRVSERYLAGIRSAFARNPKMHAATLPFAHRLDELTDARHRLAIVSYELFLRYVELGWRYAGLPYAFTSIGSCFALRANAYARHYGMNKRKAGEDFYFLHKLAREKPLGRIDEVCVYPSARLSARTPFGTGQAISQFYHRGEPHWLTTDPAVFDDLRRMRNALADLFSMPTNRWLEGLPADLGCFLKDTGIEAAVAGMRRHSAHVETFTARFFTWFDGLKAWRYINRGNKRIPIEQALASLLARYGLSCDDESAEGLLRMLRASL